MRVAVVLEQHSAKVCFWYLCYYLFINICCCHTIYWKSVSAKVVDFVSTLLAITLYRYHLQTYLDSTSFSHYTLVMMLH